MSTPLRRVRPGRRPEADSIVQPDHRPAPEPLTTTVPVSGLVGPQARPAPDPDAAVIRRMRFTRAQLADSTGVTAIATIAEQTPIIDTTKLTPKSGSICCGC